MPARRKNKTEWDPSIPQSERSFPSPTWELKKVMVRRPARGHSHSAAQPHRWFGLPRRNPREILRISVKLRGGPEHWVEVHARGRIGRYPGYVTLAEVVYDINSDVFWVAPRET